MKFIYFLLLLVPLVQGEESHEHVPSGESYEDDCTEMSEDSECVNSPAISGTCKQACTEVDEMIAGARTLCPGSCVCCTKKNNRCERIFAKGFCAAGECNRGWLLLMDHSLCPEGFVCCREAPKGSGTHSVWTEAGERGVGPHFQTFDGIKFTHGGACRYMLVKQKSTNPSFRVVSNHMPSTNTKNKLGAFHTSLEITRNENMLLLTEGNERIYFNDLEIQKNLPFESVDHSVLVNWADNQKGIKVELPGVLTVEFNGKGKTMIDLHPSQDGKVWGLLGNSNGEYKDDLQYQLSDGNEKTIDVKRLHSFNNEDLQHFFTAWVDNCHR